jgi:hypothetical protein
MMLWPEPHGRAIASSTAGSFRFISLKLALIILIEEHIVRFLGFNGGYFFWRWLIALTGLPGFSEAFVISIMAGPEHAGE